MPGNTQDWNTFTDTCLNLVSASWVLNLAVSFIITAKDIFNKIRKIVKKLRKKKVDARYRIKTVPEMEKPDEKTYE
jgi:hypothetical protein